MQLYHRVPYAAYAWKVPAYGSQADEPAPPWLVDRMTKGSVTINALGGLTARYISGTASCGPGDYIVLNDKDQIEFYLAEDFETHFKKAPKA